MGTSLFSDEKNIFLSTYIIFSQCKKDQILDHKFGEFNPQNIESQIFKVKIGKDTLLKTKGGVILSFCKNTFMGENGKVIEVSVKEVLSKKDIIKSGIPTVSSDGRLLESAGMLNVLTNPRLPINPDCPISVKMPSVGQRNMKLFVADINNGETTWNLKSNVDSPTPKENIAMGEQLFVEKCAPCHSKNLNEKSTGPGLNCVTVHYTRDWLVRFTKDSQKMIGKEDKDAICAWNRYKPTVMNTFEDLNDAQINSIYDYIESARDVNCDCNEACDSFCSETDTTSSPVVEATSFFSFTIKDYQWINIDAFVDGQLVEAFKVTFEPKEPVEAYMIFEKRRVLCH